MPEVLDISEQLFYNEDMEDYNILEEETKESEGTPFNSTESLLRENDSEYGFPSMDSFLKNNEAKIEHVEVQVL